jgi:hypothetical protein
MAKITAIIDVLHKIIVGIGVAVGTWWVTMSGQLFSQAKDCLAMQVAILDAMNREGPKISSDQLKARVSFLPKACHADETAFNKLLSIGKVVDDAQKIAAVRPSNVLALSGFEHLTKPGLGDQLLSDDPFSLGGKTTQGPGESILSQGLPGKTGDGKTPAAGDKPTPDNGWVALGYLDPKAYSDSNFGVGKTDGPVTSAPTINEVLQARWSVYVRPGAADWSKTVGLIQQGQCVKVLDTRTLGAGTRQQIWSRVEPVDCTQ